MSAQEEVTTSEPTPEQVATQERVLSHVNRIMFIRIGLSILFFCGFVIGQVSSALTGNLSQYAIAVMAMLLIAFFVMPRQVLGPKVADLMRQNPRHPWLAKAKKIQSWLVWVRLAYFLTALVLFFALPEFVGTPS